MIQLSEGVSKFMPYVLIAWCALSCGIGLSILAVKLPKYLAESRKLSKEEKVVRNLDRYMRQRNWHIASFTLLLILFLIGSMFTFWREHKTNKMATPEQIRSRASFENPKYELPILLSHSYILSASKAKAIVYKLYFGSLIGFVLAMLFNEFAGFTKNKHRLTLTMWQTIKRLESEVKELKAHSDRRLTDQLTQPVTASHDLPQTELPPIDLPATFPGPRASREYAGSPRGRVVRA